MQLKNLWEYKEKYMIPFLLILLIFILLLVFNSLNADSNRKILSEIWIKLQTALVEDPNDGYWSANRVAYILTMFISNFIVWAGILILIIVNMSFPDVPDGVIMIYGIANGVSSISKVFQKREERIVQKITNEQDNSKKESE